MLSRIRIFLFLFLLSVCGFSQIPVLNSYPAITNKVIYLDFDGQVVTGTSWNSGNTINALASTMSASNITSIWHRVSEDYRPFDVNVTTDENRFNQAPANRRMRVVITPSSAWYGSAGGVAYVGSFAWGGTPGTPCWVFENQLNYNAKNIAEAASHEIGHTMTLRHQSVYNPITCTKTAEYNPGVGTGVTSWAPIMGVGYNRNVTVWFNGRSAISCTLTQNDHGNIPAGLTSNGYLSFLPDDVGDTQGTAKILNLNALNLLDSGLINRPTDIDAYKFTICNNRYVSIGVKPWALDTVNYSGANLDVRLALYNASTNSLLAIDTPLTRLHSLVGLNLTPGTYYFTVDGGRSANYSDYGSLGKYYVRIRATNPPAMVNTILTQNNICAGQTTTLNYSSNGTPNQWQWSINGPTSHSFSVQNPTVSFSAGIHTITLLATASASSSCPTSATLNVNSQPSLAMTSTSNLLCPERTLTLSVNGASSYTWLPGAFGGTSQIVSPSVTTTYTIQGSSGTCSNSIVTTVTVVPNFTVQASASAAQICAGASVTLSASGADSYTINPGNITTAQTILSPSISTSYVVIGRSNGCNKSASVLVNVSPQFSLHIQASDTSICAGESATLTASGTSNYTFEPGGLNGPVAVVSPVSNTTYTIQGRGNGSGACEADTTFFIEVRTCDLTGLEQAAGDRNIRVYPNPASSFIHIETGDHSSRDIEISNALGQTVYKGKTNGNLSRIDSETWTKGVYLIRIRSGNETVYLERLILE